MGASLFFILGRVVRLAHKIEYWFNTKTQRVEIGKQSLSLERIGPFASFQEAERALEIVAERAKAARDDDREKDNWG
jgi:hypothetical protein